MKRFLFLIIIMPVVAFSQTDSVIKYTEVVAVTGVNKTELYQRGRSWFNNMFKSSKDVLQIQDKESGELSGKGNFESYYTYRYLGERSVPVTVHFVINIYTKDEKYKYEISDFKCDVDNPGNVMPMELPVLTSGSEYPFKVRWASQKKLNETWGQLKQNVDTKVQAIISDLKTSMSSKPANDF